MGFLPISLGVMLLYDLQIALSHAGGEVYAVIDVFPNVLGFALILWGLIRLSKAGFVSKKEIVFAGFMTFLSLLVLAKDTLFYNRFYESGSEGFAGQCLTFSQHMLILAFLVMLFRKTKNALLSVNEEKLAHAHKRMEMFVIMEGAVCLLCFVLNLFRNGGAVDIVHNVAKLLDMLLWLLIVWYGGIVQLRASLRTG